MEIRSITNKANSHFDFNWNNQIIKSKCSQGHVEMIIAFTIFIGFVATMLYFLNPTESTQISYTILDITEHRLMQNWSTQYMSSSLTLSDGALSEANGASNNCFEVNNLPGLAGNLIVKDQKLEVEKGEANSKLEILHTFNNRFYKLYASLDFVADGLSGCTELTQDYFFGSLITADTLLYEKINQTIQDYEDDYENLRTNLGLQNDFALYIYEQPVGDEPRKLIMNASIFIPQVVEVRSRDIPVTVINKNAESIHLIINIRAW